MVEIRDAKGKMNAAGRKASLGDVINAGIVATSAMTAFSYLMEDIQHENFSEPELLGQLYNEWKQPRHELFGRIAGWHLHYAMGVTWTALYAFLLENGHINDKAVTSMLIGTASGIMSVATWECMLNHSKRPHGVNKPKYYGQLVAGHVLFAMIAIRGLRARS